MGELKVQFMQIENKKSGQGMKYAKLSYFGNENGSAGMTLKG